MSTSAGRVLIIPKGEYDSTATYNMLDVVYDQNGSFICKKTSTGNAPDAEQDTEYWQRLAIPSNDVGDLSTLTTTAKSSAVAAINEVDANTATNATDIATNATLAKVLIITTGTITELPQTITNTAITSDMVCINAEYSSASAYVNATVTTANGSLTISGTLSGSTTITLYLIKSRTS